MLTVTINNVIDDYAGAVNEAAGLIASGTGTFAAAYAAAIDTITVDGFTASKVFKAGGRVYVPGHQRYYVTDADVTADGAGQLADVSLARGLERAVVSGGTVILDQTFVPIDGLEASQTYPGSTRFTIAGDTEVYELVADETASAGGDLGLVEIKPSLRTAPADNAVVTFYPPVLTNATDGKAGMLTLIVTGIAGGAVLTPEGTLDGTTWKGIGVVPADSATIASTISADGAYRMDATGWTQTRLRVTTPGTGSTTVQVVGTVG